VVLTTMVIKNSCEVTYLKLSSPVKTLSLVDKKMQYHYCFL